MAQATAAAVNEKTGDISASEAEALLKGFLKALLAEQSPHYRAEPETPVTATPAAAIEGVIRG